MVITFKGDSLKARDLIAELKQKGEEGVVAFDGQTGSTYVLTTSVPLANRVLGYLRMKGHNAGRFGTFITIHPPSAHSIADQLSDGFDQR